MFALKFIFQTVRRDALNISYNNFIATSPHSLQNFHMKNINFSLVSESLVSNWEINMKILKLWLQFKILIVRCAILYMFGISPKFLPLMVSEKSEKEKGSFLRVMGGRTFWCSVKFSIEMLMLAYNLTLFTRY